MKPFLFVLCILGILLSSCSKSGSGDSNFQYYYFEARDQAVVDQYLNIMTKDALPDNDYTVEFPRHLRQSGLFPRPVEPAKAMLGRVLFYDKHLSKDGKVSCASCHKQNLAFGDDTKVSKGVYDRSGDRNALPLGSVSNFSAYYGSDLNGSNAIPFFWDNRANTVAEQATGAMENEKEMAMHMSDVEFAVNAQPYYAPLFKKAFSNDATVSKAKILEAIANFINAMGSFQSPFDEAASQYQGYLTIPSGQTVIGKVELPGFSAQQNEGYNLYRTNCASCHSANMGRPMLINANNGLDAATTDRGVGKTTGRETDEGTFKVPTLRNIALTAPYMHDGRFATLDAVIEHYNSGIQAHPNLHKNLQVNGSPKRMRFTASQKEALKVFLNTLTDEKLLANNKFSDPFRQ